MPAPDDRKPLVVDLFNTTDAQTQQQPDTKTDRKILAVDLFNTTGAKPQPALKVDLLAPDGKPNMFNPVDLQAEQKLGKPTIITPVIPVDELPPSMVDINRLANQAVPQQIAEQRTRGVPFDEAKEYAEEKVQSALQPRTASFKNPKSPYAQTKNAPESLIDAWRAQPLETEEEARVRIDLYNWRRDMRAYIMPGTPGDVQRAKTVQHLWPNFTKPEDIVEDLAADSGLKALAHGAVRDMGMGALMGSAIGQPILGALASGVKNLYDARSTPDKQYIPVYESTAQALLRDMLTVERAVATPLRRALTYEITPDGQVVDATDKAYKAEQWLYSKLPAKYLDTGVLGGTFPLTMVPRPFQASTYPETHESTYRQFVTDLAQGEFIDYSILPKYSASVSEPVATGMGLLHSFWVPVTPPVGVPAKTAAKIVTQGRTKLVTNATLRLHKLPTLPLTKPFEAFMSEALETLSHGYIQGKVKIPQLDALMSAQLGMNTPATKRVVQQFIREKILHAVPDGDMMYVTQNMAMSRAMYHQKLPEIEEFMLKYGDASKSVIDNTSLFEAALDLIGGAHKLQFKGRAYELAKLKESTVSSAGKRITEIFRQAFTRIKPINFMDDLKGNAQAARAVQYAQQKAATVVSQLENELRNIGNATEGARVAFNKRLMRRLDERYNQLKVIEGVEFDPNLKLQVFDEWMKTSLAIHFGVDIPTSQINQATREAISLLKAPLPSNDLYARFELVASHIARKHPNLMPPQGNLGFGPVHYLSTHLGYMVKHDTAKILHEELGKVARGWRVILPFWHDPMFKNKRVLARWLNSVMGARYEFKLTQDPLVKIPEIPKRVKLSIFEKYAKNNPPDVAAELAVQAMDKYMKQAQLWADYMLRYHDLYDPNNYKAAISSFGNIPIPVVLDKSEQTTLKALSRGVSNGQLQRVLDDLHVKSPVLGKWAANTLGVLYRWNHAVTVSGLLGGAYVVLPGLRFLGNNIFSAPSIMTITVGPKLAAKGTVGAVRTALFDAVLKHYGRITPDTVRFTSATGIKYTEGDLLKLETEYNIRDSQISHEFRAGMLKSIMRTAKLTEKATKSGFMRQAYRWLGDPAAKNYLSTFAIESDTAFRRGVFRTLLAEGESPERAAHKARMALHDYSDLTRFESEYLTRFILFYTFRRQMMVATARALLLHPERLKHLYELHHALRSEEADWNQENYMYQSRFFARVSDNGESYLTGYSAPHNDSILQLSNLLDMPVDPGGKGIEIAKDIIFTPGLDYIEGMGKIDPKRPRNSSPGKVPARVVAAIMLLPEDQRDWVFQELELEYVAADKAYVGGTRVGVDDNNFGYELQFGTADGYAKYLAAVYLLHRSGLYTGLMNWGLVAARTTRPENLELGYLDDGSLGLYIIGAQTPLRVPDLYKEQLTSMKRIEAELKALKAE